jgi:diacylglycerol kinase family enzyme
MASTDRGVKHLFIVNPKSFRHKWQREKTVSGIRDFFKRAEDDGYEIHISRFPRDASGFIPLFARELGENTTLRVYAVGGDGILFDCLNGMAGLVNAELAVVPYGRTNNFVRCFGRNGKSSFRDMTRQYNAQAVPVDIMRCGNVYALNYCAVGLEAEAVRNAGKSRERMEKGGALSRWLGERLYTFFYFSGCLAALRDKKLLRRKYEVTVDGENSGGLYRGLSVFNGPFYGGNLHPVKSAAPDDGILDMLLIRSKGVLRTYGKYPFYVTGRYKWFPRSFIFKQGRKINVHSDAPLILSMDGEVFYEPALTVEVLPAAVRFVDASWQGYLEGASGGN